MSDLKKKFSHVLRRRRERTGLSQEALADKAGLHRNYVGMLERGQGVPTLAVVEKLAIALGITMTRLVGEVERAKPPNLKTGRKPDPPG